MQKTSYQDPQMVQVVCQLIELLLKKAIYSKVSSAECQLFSAGNVNLA